ncbi:hypothetical protein M758_8G132400 [Ceratodon purpureus]|nr:hypothetical protein M758_8G132400 [Ceratodon purpureus]
MGCLCSLLLQILRIGILLNLFFNEAHVPSGTRNYGYLRIHVTLAFCRILY